MRIWGAHGKKPEDQAVHIDETVLVDLLSFMDDATKEQKLVNTSFEVPLSSYLTSDNETIKYRQGVIKDLLVNPKLLDTLDELLSLCETWEKIVESNIIDWFKLFEAIKYIEQYEAIVTGIASCIGGIRDASEGLLEFKAYIEENMSRSNFHELKRWLDECCKGLTAPRSMRYVFWLNENFGIKSECLLSVDDLYYPGVVGGYGAYLRNFMKLVQGSLVLAGGGGGTYVEPVKKYSKHTREPAVTGLEPLTPPKLGYDPFQMVTNPIDISDSTKNIVSGEFKRAVGNVKTAIKSHTGWLVARKAGIAFYLRAVRICKYIDGLGFPACFPECIDMEEKLFECRDMYPMDLAVKLKSGHGGHAPEKLVLNDACFAGDNSILLITGANQGGKTTYLKTIAFIQFMFQTGIKVTCRSARISPVDGIFTIFSRKEDNTIPQGRLGQELHYIVEAFHHTGPNSLILLNEPFSSTAADSAVYLCREMLCILSALEVRSVMVSHLHSLATLPDLLSGSCYENRITNMTTELQQKGNGDEAITYRIVKGAPKFNSYAEAALRRIEERQKTDSLSKEGVMI